MSERPLPTPYYCCANFDCCVEHTLPAEDLWWSDRKQGYYCDDCWCCDDELAADDKGDSLAEELKRRGLSR